jgi:hypothetical protein
VDSRSRSSCARGLGGGRSGRWPGGGGHRGCRTSSGLHGGTARVDDRVQQYANSYLAHLAVADAAARAAALRERWPFKPAQVEPFNAGPGDIRVFADMLERCLKLATTITVARYYGDSEELGMAYFLRVFTGDAPSLARTTETS